MKATFLLLLVCSLALSCDRREDADADLQRRYDSLALYTQSQEALLEEVDAQMSEIGSLMDSIEIFEESILISLERGVRYQDYIDRMANIQQYIERSNNAIAQLEVAVGASEKQNQVYRRIIDNYKKVLGDKDATIVQLQERINQYRIEKDALVKTVDLQNDEIKYLQEEVERRQQELAEMEGELIFSKGENIRDKAQKYFLLARSTEELGDKTNSLFSSKRKKAYYRQAHELYKQAFELDATLDSALLHMQALEAKI